MARCDIRQIPTPNKMSWRGRVLERGQGRGKARRRKGAVGAIGGGILAGRAGTASILLAFLAAVSFRGMRARKCKLLLLWLKQVSGMRFRTRISPWIHKFHNSG